MTCAALADCIADHEAGELSGDARRVFHAHLERCVDCSRYLSNYRTAVQLGRRAFEEGAAQAGCAGIPPDLFAAILSARRR